METFSGGGNDVCTFCWFASMSGSCLSLFPLVATTKLQTALWRQLVLEHSQYHRRYRAECENECSECPPISQNPYLIVALGGALGSVMRYGAAVLFGASPLTTFRREYYGFVLYRRVSGEYGKHYDTAVAGNGRTWRVYNVLSLATRSSVVGSAARFHASSALDIVRQSRRRLCVLLGRLSGRRSTAIWLNSLR